MPRESILQVIDAGIRAPSGDNVQPWIFDVFGNEVRVAVAEGKDASLYNYHERASCIALGCAVENMRLKALDLGWDAEIAIDSDTYAATLRYKRGGTADPLSRRIESRHTNRKPYEAAPLTASEVDTLANSTNKDDVRVVLLRAEKARLIARASAINERVVLENRHLHSFLFEHITWTDAEDAAAPGFFIDTLELQRPQRAVFRIIRSWSLMRVANFLGISRAVSKDNAKLYATSPSIALFTTRTATPEALIRAGMQIERFWLTADALGLAVQPIAGLPLLNERLREGAVEALSLPHQKMIREAARSIFDAAGLTHEHLFFMLRVGRAPLSSARTRRVPPIIRFQ